jgi:hypothetical protein
MPNGIFMLAAFAIIERQHVGGAFMSQELPIDACHRWGSHQMNAEFVLLKVELRFDQMLQDAPQQRDIHRTDPLPVAQTERLCHLAFPRCSS